MERHPCTTLELGCAPRDYGDYLTRASGVHYPLFMSTGTYVASQRLTYKRRPRDVFLFVQRWRRSQRAGPFREAPFAVGIC